VERERESDGRDTARIARKSEKEHSRRGGWGGSFEREKDIEGENKSLIDEREREKRKESGGKTKGGEETKGKRRSFG